MGATARFLVTEGDQVLSKGPVWTPWGLRVNSPAQRTEYPRRGSKGLKEKVDTD
jgi:hypothetical protein